MKLPRDVSGGALADAWCREWEDTKVHQQGSHLIIETERPTHHRIAVPQHKRLRVGTLAAIVRSVAAHKGLDRASLLRPLGL